MLKGATNRSRTLAAALAVVGVTAMSSSAWAQCTEAFPGVSLTVGGGANQAVASALPLGTGSTASALTSTLNSINTAFLTTTSAFITGTSGVWVRGVGGVNEVKSSSTGTLSPGSSGLAFNFAGSVNCNSTVRQEYSGFQIGVDLSNQVVGNGRWNWGITGGRLQASSKDVTGAGTFNDGGTTGIIPASAFQGDTGVPYVGLYTAFTQGGFFIDGQIRWDFHQGSGSDPNNALPFSFTGRGIALTGNIGYNIPLQNGWFIEPSGGLVWSNTSFDTFNVTGTVGGLGSGTVAIGDTTSTIGRASLRFGQNIPVGKVTYQPFFSYSLFHEFNGDVTVTSTAANNAGFNGNGVVLTTKSTGGLGTYHQFAFGTAVVMTSTTAAYVRGDYKIGENIDGWGISAGYRVNF